MWPEGGAEPCVQHVLVLYQRVRLAQLVTNQVGLGTDQPAPVLLVGMPTDILPITKGCLEVRQFATAAVPDRNPVPPPQLSRDAPVAFFTKPIQVGLGVTIGIKRHAAVLDRVDGRLRQVVHLHEPLVRQVRLYRGLGPITVSQVNRPLLDTAREPQVVHRLGDLLPGLVTIQAGVGPSIAIDRPIGVQDLAVQVVLAHVAAVHNVHELHQFKNVLAVCFQIASC